MQAALEITAKYCRNEMEEYGQCVTSKPGTWQQDCHQLKVKVAQCTSSHALVSMVEHGLLAVLSPNRQCLGFAVQGRLPVQRTL
ncbi:coiled-coil-helix-coiled-coil-helix domain-containing protein 5 isoform X3 [Xenopus tropicalis]|uniref:Coiled-coil-helix-coiled-coil-helix domain-containing protein 5 isoform X3 n=1 Tax=Xenopus tropicalis TaxID=8364 RepID=A0A8J1JBI2_XENTR|nr:coiled-coil-helix-coiled-coil-helix domain-containing protein 5 isoform X3 [Xenopus tropicalis]